MPGAITVSRKSSLGRLKVAGSRSPEDSKKSQHWLARENPSKCAQKGRGKARNPAIRENMQGLRYVTGGRAATEPQRLA